MVLSIFWIRTISANSRHSVNIIIKPTYIDHVVESKYISWNAFRVKYSSRGFHNQMSLQTTLTDLFLRKVVMPNCLLLVGAGKIANRIQVLLLERNDPAGVKNQHGWNGNPAERKQGENMRKQALPPLHSPSSTPCGEEEGACITKRSWETTDKSFAHSIKNTA